MNKIYRTIWNAVRGQVVVVNEACSGHAQADGSGRKTGTSAVRKTSFRSALLALAVAGCFGAAPSFGAFADYTEEWDNDFPSASVTHYNNYTVNQGVTVTINKGIDEGDGSYLENPSALFTVDGTLTNKGTIANYRKDMPWQIGGMIDNQAGASFSGGTVTATKGSGTILQNAGTFDVFKLVGAGDISNSGTLKLGSDYALDGTLTNTGKTDLQGLTVNTGSVFDNTGTSGVNVKTLTVEGTVQGETGVVDVAANLDVRENASFTQGTVNIAGNGTNAGTMSVDHLNLKSNAGTFTNAGTGTLSVENTLDVASGKTLANAGQFTGATVKVAGTGKITNSGAKFAGTTVSVADTGSFENTAASGVEIGTLDLTGGSVSGTGSMKISASLQTAAGTTFAQNVVTTEGSLNVAGTMNIADKLTANKNATFAATASGTVAKADVNAGMKHSGSMVFTNMDATGNVESLAGTLRIDALTGTAVLSNAEGATLDLSRGTASAAASLANSGTANLKDTTFTGALANSKGTLTGTGTITSQSFSNAARADLVNLNTGAVTASGETNVSGKLTGTSTAQFDAGAEGTIAEAEIAGNITHAGNQTITTLANSAEIANTAGVLTVETLTGESRITNADGATLAFANGTQNAASLQNNGTANLGTFTASGDISNAKDLTATGKITAQNFRQTAGQSTVTDLQAIAALETAGIFTASGTVTAGQGNNTGTFSAQNLTVTGAMHNSASLTSTGTADITNLTQSAGSARFAAATLRGTGTLAGSVESSGILTFAENSNYSGAGTISSASDLMVRGDVLMTSSVTAQGKATVVAGKTLKANGFDLATTDIAGTLEETGTGTIDNLAMRTGSMLKNSGHLTISKASAIDGVTYQQEGDGSLTMSDGKWFGNSTINVFGGTIVRGENGLGSGNTYNIKNEAAGDLDSGALDPDWQDSRTVVSVDTMDMGSTVNLLEGGVLDVENISFTAEGSQKLLNFQGGALVTTLDQIFTDVTSDAIDMEAVDAETGRVEIKGSVIGLTSVGDFNTGIREHTLFKTGDIVFEDASITVDLVADVSKRIASATEEGGTIDLHFMGSTAQVFTADVANRVIEANADPKVRAIFDTSTLYVRNDANPSGGKTLLIADSDEADSVRIKDDIGFRNVLETELVKIKDGHEFALIGTTEGGSLIGTNGAVEVSGEGSTFTLGTLGRAEALTGTIAKVTLTEGGRLYGKNQSYTVTEIDAQNGKVETGAGGTLNTANLKFGAAGVLANAGTINATNWQDVAGTQSVNNGMLKVTNDATVAGTLETGKGAATVFENKLTVTGKVTNKSQGRNQGMEVGALDVAVNDGFVNEGNLLVKGDTNILAGNDSASSSTKTYAFHNKASGIADLSGGKLTIGGVEAGETLRADGGPIFAVAMNEGQMKLGEAEIAAGSQLQNAADAQVSATNLKVAAGGLLWNKTDGIVSADTLTAQGSVRNFGTLSVKNGDFAGTETSQTIANNGVMLFRTFSLSAGADFLNAGTMRAEDATLCDAETEYKNEEGKTAEFNNLTVASGASYENLGTLKVYDSLTVTGEGSVLTNRNEGTVVNDITIADGASLTQVAGDFSGNTLKIEGGELLVTGGDFSAVGGVEFTDGLIAYQGTDKEKVTGSLALKSEIGGTIAVENASLTLGRYQVETPDTPETQADGLPSAKHIFAADYAPLDLGANGKLAVGENAVAKAETMQAGDAWFGSDSLFVIDTKTGMTNVENGEGGTTIAALVGSGNLSVENGAKLHIKNIGWGSYYVTKDFADEKLAGGSWQDFLTFDPADSGKDVVLKQDADGNVILTVVRDENPDTPDNPDDPAVDFPSVAMSNLVQEVISNPNLRDPRMGGAIGFINKVVEIDDEGIMVEAINAVGNFAAAAGVASQNVTFASNVADMTERHLAFEDVHFKNGALRTWDGVRLWANALGQHVEQSGAGYKGGSADYDGWNTGFIFGGDLIASNGLRFGAAFAAQRGNLDSNGNVVSTKNEADAFSLVGYAAKDFGRLNVIGTLAYTNVESDLEQSLGVVGMGKHKLELSNDVFEATVKGEFRMPLSESISLIPYAGLRVVSVSSDDATSKIDGKKAFKYDVDSVLQFQMPIGASVQTSFATESGWNLRGLADLSVTPVFGDKDFDADVRGHGLSAVDRTRGTVSDDVAGALRVGFSAERDGFAVGGELEYAKGGAVDDGITFGINARYRF